jgi:hypothetical protein
MNWRQPIYAGEQDLKIVSDQVWHVLLTANNPPALFRNGDRMVRIERNDFDTPVIREVTAARLTHHLARICHFFELNKAEERVSARPPKGFTGRHTCTS